MRIASEDGRCRNPDDWALIQVKDLSARGANQHVMPVTQSLLKTSCAHCTLREICLPLGLSEKETLRLDTVIVRRRIRRGQHLYDAGASFEALYAIKNGFFKTEALLEDGRNQVTDFQMTADLLGLDGISTESHTCNAVALEDSEVCIIPFAQLESLLHEIQAFQHHFHKIMSRKIVHDHNIMMLLGKMCAEERLAAFLLNLSQRFTTRGYSPQEFHLRMTREEIGSYLGLKLETVSRIFSRFQEEGFISVQQKHIRILHIEPLQRLLARRSQP
jgi:CRP/FNR family transcriptional regulator